MVQETVRQNRNHLIYYGIAIACCILVAIVIVIPNFTRTTDYVSSSELKSNEIGQILIEFLKICNVDQQSRIPISFPSNIPVVRSSSRRGINLIDLIEIDPEVAGSKFDDLHKDDVILRIKFTDGEVWGATLRGARKLPY